MRVIVKKVSSFTDGSGCLNAFLKLTKKHKYKIDKKHKFEFDSLVVSYNDYVKDRLCKKTVLDCEFKKNDDDQVQTFMNKISGGELFKDFSKCSCGSNTNLLQKDDNKLIRSCKNVFCPYKFSTPIFMIFLRAVGIDDFKNNVSTYFEYIRNFPTGMDAKFNVDSTMSFVIVFKQSGKKNTKLRRDIIKNNFKDTSKEIMNLESKVQKYIDNKEYRKDFWDIMRLPFIESEDIKILKKHFKWKSITTKLDITKILKYWKKSNRKFKSLFNNFESIKTVAIELDK